MQISIVRTRRGLSREKLAHIADQIAELSPGYPEEEATADVHDRVATFWSLRMQQDLYAVIEDESVKLDRLSYRRSAGGHGREPGRAADPGGQAFRE